MRRGRCSNSGKRNLTPGFCEGKTVNLKEHKPQQKLHTLVEAKIIDSSHKSEVPCISYNVIINAEITHTAVTSKMRMVTGQGLEEKSLVVERSPLLSEEVD